MIDENKLKEQMFALVEQIGDERLHIDAVVHLIDDAPTVDAVPVRHGRWEWNGEAFICSACGNGHKGQPTIMGQPMFEFCPMCGADMRKDGDHDS